MGLSSDVVRKRESGRGETERGDPTRLDPPFPSGSGTGFMDHQIMHDAPPADVHDVIASKEQEVCMALSSAPPCSIPPHQGATGGRVPAAVSFLSRLRYLLGPAVVQKISR